MVAMSYRLFQAQAEALRPWRSLAGTTSAILRQMEGGFPNPWLRPMISACEMLVHTQLSTTRPSFGVEEVPVGNEVARVDEIYLDDTPFGRLLHFRKSTIALQPKVLVVAPMSGHFATLLAPTVRTLLMENDVYITDWQNARDIAVTEGRFGLDEYIDHVMRFLRRIGPDTHVLAVCQPAVPVLAATALMAEDDDPCQPLSLTLMAGPIDTRINPTGVNALATEHDLAWFEQQVIDTVPWPLRGAGRRVYPGYVQLTAFVSMNLERHMQAQLAQMRNLVGGNLREIEAHNTFYDEYLAVMDLPAEFFLETIGSIFQRHDLPLGRMRFRDRTVDTRAIRRTAILTVEGERDDICGQGQTSAALDLCANVPATMKRHHLQTGVGHYGVFSGRRWVSDVYPKVQAMINRSSGALR